MDSSSASAGFFLLDINKHANVVDDDDDDDSQPDTPAAAPPVAVESVAVTASENVGESSGCVLMRNFDMNSLPSGAEDDGSGSSSAMSMVCSSPPRDAVPFCAADDDCNLNGHSRANEEGSAPAEPSVVAPRKKLRLSKEQAALLEESFREHHTLNPKQKNALAKQLNLKSRQVEVWFQNRRARTKLKQTEVDCELLKRCCESLTEENRRLKREIEELRATKVGLGVGLGLPCMVATHHHSHIRNHHNHNQSHNHQDMFMQLPAATLGICPSCNRLDKKLQAPLHFVPKNVVTASSSAAAAAASAHSHTHAYYLAAAFKQPSAAPC